MRSLLVFSALPVERAYIYFFNDEDKPALHASAGLTRHFQPKPSYHALAHFQRVLGEYRFNRVVKNEPGQVRVQEYRDAKKAKRLIWAVWSPTGEGRSSVATLEGTPGKLVGVQKMPLGPVAAPSPSLSSLRSKTPGRLEVPVDESPLYLVFEQN